MFFDRLGSAVSRVALFLKRPSPTWLLLVAVAAVFVVPPGIDRIQRAVTEHRLRAEIAEIRRLNNGGHAGLKEPLVRAIKVYRDAVQAEVSEDLLNDIAELLGESGAQGHAYQLWQKLCRHDPANPKYIRVQADMRYFYTSADELAVNEVKTAIRLDEDNPELWALLAHCTHHLHYPPDEVRGTARHALRLAEKNDDVDAAVLRKGLAHILEDSQEAEKEDSNKKGSPEAKEPSSPNLSD